jgi:hypothetical protein
VKAAGRSGARADAFAAAAAAIAALGACARVPAAAPPPAERADLALRPYAGRLRALDVTIGGAALPFLFDTGGGITLLTPATAAAAGCTPWGRLTGFRMSGERLDVPRCGPVPVSAGGARASPESAVLDLMALLPPGLPALGGVASLQTFEGRTVTLDLGGNRLAVEPPGSAERAAHGMSPLAVRAQREMGGAGLSLFLAVDGRRGPLWFLVDSGNLEGVLVAPHALEDLADPDALAALRAGGAADLTLPIGGLGPARVRARSRDLVYDGAIGAELLERMVVVVDLERVRAWARWR